DGHECNAVLDVLRRGIEDAHLLAGWQVAGHAPFHTGHQFVPEPNVCEGATNHDLVISPSGSVAVPVPLTYPVFFKVSGGRRSLRDRARGRNMIRRDAVADLHENPGPFNVLRRARFPGRDSIEERRA